MYQSSPFRSTLNTGYITCLGMCKVCTEAVHSVALCQAQKAQMPKRGPGKKDRNRARGVFQGRRTSRSAGIYIFIYIFFKYTLTLLGTNRNAIPRHFWRRFSFFPRGDMLVYNLLQPWCYQGKQSNATSCTGASGPWRYQLRWPQRLRAKKECHGYG